MYESAERQFFYSTKSMGFETRLIDFNPSFTIGKMCEIRQVIFPL